MSIHQTPGTMKYAAPVLAVLFAASVHAQMTITLTPSDYNGYGVSFFGANNGSIDLTVIGGTPPYTYEWSNDETTQDINNLAAGYYEVVVTDANGEQLDDRVTLEAPEELQVFIDKFEYANEHNVSCYNCFNGYIYASAVGGLGPYTFDWDDGSTAQNRFGVGAGEYQLTVTDANGNSVESEYISMTQPERDDWTMGGNYGTNPATQYIGTADNKDVVFKSNGQERLRLLGNGEIKMVDLASVLGPGEEGVLKIGGGGGLTLAVTDKEDPSYAGPFWKTDGNYIGSTSGGFLGTTNGVPLRIRTNSVERMIINTYGRVTLGEDLVSTPSTTTGRLNLQSNNGEDWLSLTRSGGGGTWHLSDAQAQSLQLYYTDNNGNDVVGGIKLWNDGKVSIGDVPTNTTTDYGLYVHMGVLTQKVKVAVPTSSEWSDHVFNQGYKLLPLEELRKFIHLNGHLPGVPSADEMVESGLDVLKTDAMLLEKIEELTLYILHLEGRVAELEKR